MVRAFDNSWGLLKNYIPEGGISGQEVNTMIAENLQLKDQVKQLTAQLQYLQSIIEMYEGPNRQTTLDEF
tara:strand:- start:672 stop:881 length:210 start_codon:yes stop_codon:yes gene_type:complete